MTVRRKISFFDHPFLHLFKKIPSLGVYIFGVWRAKIGKSRQTQNAKNRPKLTPKRKTPNAKRHDAQPWYPCLNLRIFQALKLNKFSLPFKSPQKILFLILLRFNLPQEN